MTHDIDQITESFAAHEHLVPDADSVLVRAQAIARSYHRRRWAVRATGGAVLAGGLVAGGIALPGQGHSTSPGSKTLAAAAASSASPTPTASAMYTNAQEMAAYFAGGFDYANAEDLASFWNSTGDISSVKAAAGLKLLEGQTLPVTPSTAPYKIVAPDNNVEAFFNAGYDYNDAVTLAGIWHVGSYHAKAEGGQKLLAGETLPIPPSGPPSSTSSSNTGARTMTKAALHKLALLGKKVVVPTAGGTAADDGMTPADQAYFNAGYDYNDAVSLGKVWNETNITTIKSEAGQKLLDGETLPVAPSGTPVAPEDKDVEAFFNAGYTMNDAIKLGKLWNISDTYQVKIDGGKKLIAGQTLPIAP